MGEHICFRRNERLATVNPHWRGNPVVRGKFVNRQHRFRPGMGSVLKWRLSPNPQRKEKKSVKWSPKLNYLRSLDGVVGNSLIWLGHNSFFLQLGRKRIMFDPVFGDIPFVKRQSDFPANPDIFTDIDYLLISHDHFDHLDKQSVARLVKNNPGMKLFCGLGTGELIKGWLPELEVTEAGWYPHIEDDGLKIRFFLHNTGAKVPFAMEGAGCGGHLWYRPMVFPSTTAVIPVTPGISAKYPIFSELPIMLWWVSGPINRAGLCNPIIYRLMML